MRRARPAGVMFAALAIAAGGCIGEAGPGDTVAVAGAIYTDMHVDLPCAEVEDQFHSTAGGRGLTGIGLTFRDDRGEVLGQGRTLDLQTRQLADGCRLLAPYRVQLPPAASYRVTFEVPEVANPRGSYFSGTDELTEQSISAAQLEAADYEWSFEVPPSFVTP